MSFLNKSEKAIFVDEKNGVQYFQESDSYYNYRLTSNFLNNGYLGDKKIDGVVWDSYSYYPPGVPMDYSPLIAWLALFSYYLLNIFSNVSLIKVCFWLPAFIAPLGGVAGFLFVRRFAGNLGGFFTGMLLVTSSLYCFKTVPGFFDTDMFNVILPIMVIWTFAEAERAEIFKNKILLAISSGFFMFVFVMAWSGWQYIFYLIVFSCLVYYLIGKIRKWDLNNFLSIFAIFLGTSLVLIGISYPLSIYKLFLGLLGYKDVLLSSHNIWMPWPNTYDGVSELKNATLNSIIFQTGPLTILMGFFGILIVFLNEKGLLKYEYSFKIRYWFRNKKNKNNEKNVDTSVFIKINKKASEVKLDWFLFLILFLWSFTAALSLIKGARFIILLLPPLAIFSGITLGVFLDKFNFTRLPLSAIKQFILILMVILIVSPQIIATYQTTHFITPFYDDYHAQSAEWIDNKLPQDTVIITNWGYGHFYSAMAKRPVSFDGRMAYIETLPTRSIQYSSLNISTDIPNTSRDYWFAMALATDNITFSRHVLTMLATSGDNAYLVLNKYSKNKKESKEILNDILGFNRSSAYHILLSRYRFSSIQAQEILKYSHPSNSRLFVLITMPSMLEMGKYILSTNTKTDNIIYQVNELPEKYGWKNLRLYKSHDKLLWEGNEVYNIITINNGMINESLINKNGKVSIYILKDSNKEVIIDKKYQNSIFIDLVVKNIAPDGFDLLYKNKNVNIWKTD